MVIGGFDLFFKIRNYHEENPTRCSLQPGPHAISMACFCSNDYTLLSISRARWCGSCALVDRPLCLAVVINDVSDYVSDYVFSDKMPMQFFIALKLGHSLIGSYIALFLLLGFTMMRQCSHIVSCITPSICWCSFLKSSFEGVVHWMDMFCLGITKSFEGFFSPRFG